MREGAAAAAAAKVTMLPISKEGNLPEDGWETLTGADAIVMGSPTYMGGPAWQFKKFADASSKPCFSQAWKDKVAGAFTNSAAMDGDKGLTIGYLIALAMQHGMVYAGLGILPASSKAALRNDVNWLGGASGALGQSPSDSSPDEGPSSGDLATARLYGRRIADMAGQRTAA